MKFGADVLHVNTHQLIIDLTL